MKMTPRRCKGTARLWRTLGVLLVALAELTSVALARALRKPLFVDDRAQNYLMNFGYLPWTGLETGNLRTDDQLKDAIKSLQRFGGIPETGELDERTQNLMRKRRCGLPDKPDPRMQEGFHHRFKRYALHGVPWKHLDLTWSLRTNSPSGLDTGRVRRELSRALNIWADNSNLTFREINSDNADILIYFYKGYHNDGYQFDGKGQILAHAFFPENGDVHFDADEDWVLDFDGEGEGTSLFAVAAHEFGHSLGLAHSSVSTALMYSWYQELPKDYILPEDDKHGVQQLYGAKRRLWGNKTSNYPDYNPRFVPSVTTTTQRPRRPRPNPPTPPKEPPCRPTYYPEERHHRPNHYPEEGHHRANHYPKDCSPPQRPPKTDYPERHRPTTAAATTTTMTTTHRPYHHHPSINTVGYPSFTTPRPRYRPPVRKDVPDKCDTSYDAISMIRRELFIFKGRYVWRLNDGGLMSGFPAEITRMFKFPMELDHVDAVYERIEDSNIVFFIGRYYYVFEAFKLLPGYPKPLTHLGLPYDLKKIDGAMVWGHNKGTYFFSGSMYWRFDENNQHVDLDYPRDISMFAGVPTDIDAVFQWKNGTTYFFKDKHFWQFDDWRMRVAHKHPKSSAYYWMNCPRGLDNNDVGLEDSKTRFNGVAAGRGSSAGALTPGLRLLALALVILLTSRSALLASRCT